MIILSIAPTGNQVLGERDLALERGPQHVGAPEHAQALFFSRGC